MSYAIVYDSSTGNTQRLACAVKEALPAEEILTFGRVGDVTSEDLAAADRVYAGFSQLEDKDVFLFGTAGFGADQTYFAGVMARVARHVPESARIAGSFMCQGQMPESVRTRYERTAQAQPAQAARMQQLIENFDAAVGHPDDADVARLQAAVKQV